MKFLHFPISASAGAVIEVTLSKQANVRLLDTTNFNHYHQGQQHEYHGGHAQVSPFRLQVPHSGNWHVVVDLGGYGGTVRASVRVL